VWRFTGVKFLMCPEMVFKVLLRLVNCSERAFFMLLGDFYA